LPQGAPAYLKQRPVFADVLGMADNRRRGQLVNLAQRRRRRVEEALVEAKGQMIEAEHALFVALRLAGHQNGEPRTAPAWREESSEAVDPGDDMDNVLPIFPGGKRAA
jgi:hypothetical protein